MRYLMTSRLCNNLLQWNSRDPKWSSCTFPWCWSTNTVQSRIICILSLSVRSLKHDLSSTEFTSCDMSPITEFLVFSSAEQCNMKCSRVSSSESHNWHVGFTLALLQAALFDFRVYAPQSSFSFIGILLRSLLDRGSILSNWCTFPGK